MGYTVTESMLIAAPAAAAYAVIADYRRGHPAILPSQLKNLRVVGGPGVGAGTTITFESHMFGTVTRFRAEDTEPEPGRVLVETNSEPVPSVTTFTVEPAGTGARVTIATEFLAPRGGLRGRVERWVIARTLPKMYRAEMRNLERHASRWTVPGENAGTQTAM